MCPEISFEGLYYIHESYSVHGLFPIGYYLVMWANLIIQNEKNVLYVRKITIESTHSIDLWERNVFSDNDIEDGRVDFPLKFFLHLLS